MLLGRCAVVVSALALVLVASGAASALELTVRDSRHDVWRISPSAVAPSVRNGDVLSTLFRHGSDDVVVTSRYVDLRRVGLYAHYTVRIETGAHSYREARIETTQDSWAGKVRVFNRRGRPVACRARHQISYRDNVVRLVVPRSCLNTPKYIQATAASYWANPDGDIYTDNPHSTQPSVRAWTRWIASS